MVGTRFYLPVWHRSHLSSKCAIDAIRWQHAGWVGLVDGCETVDFGLRSEALACANFFAKAK